MRKAFLFVALMLGGTSAASGQLLHHCGEGYQGHVSAARVETARYEKVGGEWVEGPRRLSTATVYSEDRLWSEQTVYDDAGNASDIYVRTCYENGRYAEIAHYDGERRLRTRQLHSRDGDLIQFLDAAGGLVARVVLVRDGAGRLAGQRTYDGAGRLTREQVREREGQAFVVKEFDGEGRLLSKTVSSAEGANGEGRISHDRSVYGPNGTVGTARETTVIRGGRQAEETRTFATKGLSTRSTVRGEKDERGNVVKNTQYELNPATGGMEPRSAVYREITYF